MIASTTKFSPLARYRWFSKVRSRSSPWRLKKTAPSQRISRLALIEPYTIPLEGQMVCIRPASTRRRFSLDDACDEHLASPAYHRTSFQVRYSRAFDSFSVHKIPFLEFTPALL